MAEDTSPAPFRRSGPFAALLWPVLFLLGAAAYSILYGRWVLEFGGRFTPDSVMYIDSAQNLVVGRGLSLSTGEIHRLIETGESLPRPMTTWAPLYPLMIAALTFLGLAPPSAAIVITLAFHFGILLATYLLIARLYDPWRAMVAVAFLMHLPALRLIAERPWSETLGLTFAITALWILTPNASRAGRGGYAIFLSGVAAGLAVAARYALLPLLVVGFALLFRRGPLREWRRSGALFAAGFFLIAAPLFARNLYWSGQLGGARWGASHTGLGEALGQFVSAGAWSLQIENPVAWVVLAALLLASARGAGLLVMGQGLGAGLWDAGLARGRYALLLWPFLYTLFLLYAQIRYPIDAIGARLVMPAVITVVPFIVAVLSRLAKLRPFVLCLAAYVLLVAALWEQMNRNDALQPGRILAPYDMQRKRAHSESLTWLHSHLGDGDLLIGENGFDLPLYLGPVDSVYWSPDKAPGRHLSFDTVERYLTGSEACARYESLFLLVSPKGGAPELIAEEFGAFIATLVTPDGILPPRIQPVFSGKDGLIFEILCPPESTSAPPSSSLDEGSPS